MNLCLLLSFYISTKLICDQNVFTMESYPRINKTGTLVVEKERIQRQILPVLLGRGSRHIGKSLYKCKCLTRFGKSKINYYSNSDASFNYEYLRLCGDINPNPGPVTRTISTKCSSCLKGIKSDKAATCCICNSQYHKKCGGNTGNNALDKRNWICTTCLFHQEVFPFANIAAMNESVSDNSVITKDDESMLSESAELSALEMARQENSNDMLLCHLNINSIQNKFEELKDIITKFKVQIMVVSETKIDSSYPDSQFHVPGYYLHRQDRKKGGGGILMLVSSKIQSKRIKIDRRYKTIEPLALEIGLKTRKVILLAIYRPPKKVTGSYQLLLEEEMSHISNWAVLQHQSVIIIGDLNLNRLKPDSAEGKFLLDLEVEQGFDCLITSPTRTQMQGALTTQSLIDVILTNQPELFGNCGVYNPEISDHALIYGFMKEKAKPQKGRVIKFRSMKNFDEKQYKEDLSQAPWHVGEIFDTIDEQAGFWESLFSSIVNKHLPEKKMRVRPQDVPYMSREWKNAIRAKRRAARKYQKEQTKENWENKRKLRNEATRLRRKAIREYWKDQSTLLTSKPSQFYKTFMPFLGAKKKKNTTDLSLNIDENICHDQFKIANHLCNYFANIAKGIGNTDEITDNTFATHASVQSIMENSAAQDSIQFQILNRVEVETALQSLNTRKSNGWDGIPSKALKAGARELSIPLTTLYNSCITCCEWPTMWKKGEWTPVFKKEDPHEKENYRPITVQVTVNKIFEQLLSKQLSHGFKNKLCDKLTAYRKRNSCETALLSLTENWKMALDERKIVGVLSTDMSKAFDSLHHPLMLAKLKAYGVNDNSIRLLNSYFTDRFNRVKLGPVVSSWERVSRGCPQGSAFGPLLWNIFQNDLTYDISTNLNMYADDHQFYDMSSNLADVHANLTVSAEVASNWYSSNFLKGNFDKYRTLTLGNKCDHNMRIVIGDVEVKSTACLKLLGVSIDNDLRFVEHITTICKKSSQRVGVLMRLRNLIPTSTKLQLFKAAILPYLTYSHLVWHFCRASDSRKLERIQERALRAIYCDKTSSYNTLLGMANLCTLQNRRLQDMATLMYKVKNNICPKYIADLFRRSDTKYALRNKEFVIPRFNTATYGKHSIRHTGPKLWNIVPKNIRDLPTLSSFKINIRKIDLNTLLTDNHCANCILCST